MIIDGYHCSILDLLQWCGAIDVVGREGAAAKGFGCIITDVAGAEATILEWALTVDVIREFCEAQLATAAQSFKPRSFRDGHGVDASLGVRERGEDQNDDYWKYIGKAN